MIKSNFHTHTTYCDGTCDIESVVKSAIEKGFSYLGFSSHSYIAGDDLWTLKKDSLTDYVAEVLRVKEKYKEKITILLGVEQDLNSEPYNYDFDYVIGSMHSVEKNGKFYPVDYNVETFKYLLESVYLGDYNALCKDYYEQLTKIPCKTKANIIAHFDLITKYADALNLTLPKNYLSYAESAIKSIIKSVSVFEINTGAIKRGYKKFPYPSKEILQIIYNLGGKIMINSDCHDKDSLDYGFLDAVKLAKEVGYKKSVIVTSDGFKEVNL